jgi:hypothetical protein
MDQELSTKGSFPQVVHKLSTGSRGIGFATRARQIRISDQIQIRIRGESPNAQNGKTAEWTPYATLRALGSTC